MRTGLLVGVLMALALVGPFATAATALTEIEKDEKAVKKYAIHEDDDFDAKARGLCVCLDAGSNLNKMGLLTYQRIIGVNFDTIQVLCEVVRYDQATGQEDGRRATLAICDTWVLLAK